MTVCPICENRFSDSEVSFCLNCAWDIKNDPMFTISLDRMPENLMAEWQKRREVARKVWNERKRLEALEAEQQFWHSCQKQDTVKAYQDYERKYPNGAFIKNSRKLRQQLEQEQNQQRKAKEDQEYWNQQSQIGGKTGFENYLKKYPQGRYAAEARKAIQQFDKQKAEKIQKEQEENRKADERRFWDACQKQGTIKAYQDYEQKYPNGAFIKNAQNLQQQLEQEQNKQRKAKDDQEYWNQQSRIGGKTGFENYLKKNPQGRYVAEARKAIQQFGKQQAEKIQKEMEKRRNILGITAIIVVSMIFFLILAVIIEYIEEIIAIAFGIIFEIIAIAFGIIFWGVIIYYISTQKRS